MYNTPRQASIQASEGSKLWSIDRTTFRGIVTYFKLERMKMYMDFLKMVKIGGKTLGEVLSTRDLDHMALALERDTFKQGDVIIREGEKGDIFYIIESGTVEVSTKADGEWASERSLARSEATSRSNTRRGNHTAYSNCSASRWHRVG